MTGLHHYKAPDYNNNFDLLRLTGALLVMFSHAYGQMADPSREILYRLTNHHIFMGNIGLMIFFVISGYLVTQSLLQTASVKKYIARRILRIYPAYIVNMLLLLFILGAILTSLPLGDYFSNRLTWKFLYENILIIPSSHILPGVFNETDVNPSAWTVPFELKLYLLLLLIYLIPFLSFKWKIGLVFFVCLILGLFVPVVLLQRITGHNLNVWYSLGFYFISGSLLNAFKDKIPIHYIGIFILVTVLLVTHLLGLPGNFLKLLCITYTIIWLGTRTPVILKLKWDLSYGIYLYAAPVQLALSQLSHHSLPLWQYNLISTPIIVLLAALSWNLVEKKAKILKNKI